MDEQALYDVFRHLVMLVDNGEEIAFDSGEVTLLE